MREMQSGSNRRRRRTACAAICAALFVAMIAPAAASALTTPTSDPFYTAPAHLTRYADGTILRSREVTMSGAQQSGTAAAYQLMFRTTNATGQAVAAVTTVLVPKEPADGARKLASYQTAYDSLTLSCAPSYTLQGGNGGGGDTATVETALIGDELSQGWDVNVPDYEGLDSEWVVGPLIGRATLDSIRAAEHFAADGLDGDGTKVTMNGYSGGSEATTWAAALAPSYAPELNIVGAAAGGNFPNLDYTLSQFDGSLWYGTAIGVMEAFSRAYSQFDLKTLLNPAGLALAAKDGQDASGCGGSTLNEPFGKASEYTNFPTSAALAADPLVVRVLAKASLDNAPLPKTPLFLYNATEDELAHIVPVDALVAMYCAKGVTVDYDRDPLGLEHIIGLTRYWPLALQYLEARFAGEPAPDTCGPATVQPPAVSTSPCATSAGRLSGSTLGPVALGATRASARRAFGSRPARHGGYVDVFCSGPAAVSAGYATPAELRTVGSAVGRGLRGHVVWLVTASRAYTLRGVRTGMSVSAAARRVHLRLALVRGATRWYMTSSGRATGLVAVRHGEVRLVGIASRRLAGSARSRTVLLRVIARAV